MLAILKDCTVHHGKHRPDLSNASGFVDIEITHSINKTVILIKKSLESGKHQECEITSQQTNIEQVCIYHYTQGVWVSCQDVKHATRIIRINPATGLELSESENMFFVSIGELSEQN